MLCFCYKSKAFYSVIATANHNTQPTHITAATTMVDGTKSNNVQKGGQKDERSVVSGADQPRQQQQEDANTNTEMISRLMPTEAIALNAGTVIGSGENRKWRVLSRLGSGAFGAVFLVEEEAKKKEQYALKAERMSAQVQMLAIEVQVYQALMSQAETTLEGQKRRYPLLIDKGEWSNQYNYLVMSLVGPSLEDLRRRRPNNKFSLGTAVLAARKTLAALLQLHLVGFLHRDVKPANFSIGHSDTGVIYILDFGMARCFVNSATGVLKRPRAGNIGFRGTAKYASRIGHRHKELCRGDDVESWFYMACELIKGKLPWHRIDDEARIRDMKSEAMDSEKKAKKSKDQKTETKSKDSKTETKSKDPKTETKSKDAKAEKSKDQKVETKDTKTEKSKEEKTEKDPRRLLLGGCPKQFAHILDLVAPLRYYDDPPYDAIAADIGAALTRLQVPTYPLDWQVDERSRGGAKKT